jgi:hypothetical protein
MSVGVKIYWVKTAVGTLYAIELFCFLDSVIPLRHKESGWLYHASCWHNNDGKKNCRNILYS